MHTFDLKYYRSYIVQNFPADLVQKYFVLVEVTSRWTRKTLIVVIFFTKLSIHA